MAPIGNFIARYLKPIGHAWYVAHRATMTTTILFTTFGIAASILYIHWKPGAEVMLFFCSIESNQANKKHCCNANSISQVSVGIHTLRLVWALAFWRWCKALWVLLQTESSINREQKLQSCQIACKIAENNLYFEKEIRNFNNSKKKPIGIGMLDDCCCLLALAIAFLDSFCSNRYF